MMRLFSLLVAAFCAVATQSSAATITFDDYTTANRSTIGHTYAGLTWTNFTVQKALPSLVGTGFVNGVTSGEYTAYNTGARVGTVTSNKNFALNSFTLASAWRTGLNVLLTAYDNGVAKFSQTFVVNTTGPLYVMLDWKGIDKLTFATSGGTSAGLGSNTRSFALDTMEVAPVPLPATAPLALLGFGALAAARRRRSA
jgi:hypothetical protein